MPDRLSEILDRWDGRDDEDADDVDWLVTEVARLRGQVEALAGRRDSNPRSGGAPHHR